MRHGKGTDLPGMTDPEGEKIGVVYVSPEDDRKTVLTAILAEERLKREQIVLVLPQQNRAFNRPQDFDDLKSLRRKLQGELIFITPAGPGPAEFARQRRFPVFSTEESFVRSFTTGSPNPPPWSTATPTNTPQSANRPMKRGLFGFGGGAKKAAPIAAAGAAGFVAGEAVSDSGRAGARGAANAGSAGGNVGNYASPRSSRGLTRAGDVTNMPTQPVSPRSSRSLRPVPPAQTPLPSTEDEDTPLTPAGTEVADTVDQPDERDRTGRNVGLAGAAGLGAGFAAADFAQPRAAFAGQGATPTGPNIDSDDDWDELPPAPAQSGPARLPNTPTTTEAGIVGAGVGARAASGAGAAARVPVSAVNAEPNAIELPMGRSTTKVTKKLSPSAVAGMATQAVPSTAPTTTTTTMPRRNTGKVVAAGVVGAAAGAVAAGALASNTANSGNATASATRTAGGAGGGSRPPMRNLSSIGPGGAGTGGPMNPRRTPPPDRGRWRIALVALILLTLLFALGAWALSANPRMLASVGNTLSGNANTPATITITPANKVVQDTYLMQGVTGTADPVNRQVTVRTLNTTKTTVKPANITGHTQTAAVTATGILTFLNGSTSSETIAPTAITNVNGIQVIADGNVTIAGLNPNNGQAGVATVSAHAVSPGASGNIGAGTISGTCCLAGGFIIVKNLNAFTGGQNAQNYNFLQESDVNAVVNANQDGLKTDAQNDIKGQMKAGEQLLGTINCDDPKTTEDVLPGPHGVNVQAANVTVNVSCSAQVFDASAVQSIAQQALQQKASKDPGPGYVQAGAIVTQAQQPVILPNSVTFPVAARGVWYYPWTPAMKQNLLNKIKGKSVKEAQAILNSYPGVGNARISTGNGVTTLPGDTNQITLDIKTVNGLSGSNQQTGPGGAGGNSTVPPQPSITPIVGNGTMPEPTSGAVKG